MGYMYACMYINTHITHLHMYGWMHVCVCIYGIGMFRYVCSRCMSVCACMHAYMSIYMYSHIYGYGQTCIYNIYAKKLHMCKGMEVKVQNASYAPCMKVHGVELSLGMGYGCCC